MSLQDVSRGALFKQNLHYPLIVAALFAIAFLVPNDKWAINISRIGIFLPVFLFLLIPNIKSFFRGRFIQLFFAYSIYTILVSFFMGNYEKLDNFASRFISTIAFLFLIYKSHDNKSFMLEEIFVLFSLLGLLLIFSTVNFLSDHKYSDLRYGVFKTVLDVAWLSASATLVALHGLIYKGGTLRLIAFTCLLFLLALCQERGAYVFFLIGFTVIALSSGQWRKLAFAILILSITGIIIEITNPGFSHKLILRGDSYRFEIWGLGLKSSTESLLGTLFGHGLGSNLSFTIQNGYVLSHYHNLYLNIMFYSGIIGLVLFLLPVAYIAINISIPTVFRSAWLPVLLGSLGAGMFDGIHVLNNQGSMMFTLSLSLFWLGTHIDSLKLEKADAKSI